MQRSLNLCRPTKIFSVFVLLLATLSPLESINALELPTIISDGMVIQCDKPVHLWGWSTAGGEVTVSMGESSKTVTVGSDGRFDVELDAMPANAKPSTIEFKDAQGSVSVKDVLVGEVWVCSGQSNMRWTVNNSDDADLEKLSAKYPSIRLITVPNVAAEEPKKNFDGSWTAVTPESVGDFSAVGYFFGRQIHQTLDVPVGLINNAWGGSAAEAWVPPSTLEEAGTYGELLGKWNDIAAGFDVDAEKAKVDARLKKWQEDGRKGRRPWFRNPLTGNQRPGNLYFGCLAPVIGYTIQGTIWYQGESNAGRAYQYRDLFPRMISKWRKDWKQGDFSFYWVQLADFMAESDTPKESAWAELREAQTMALSLPNTGQAVIIDLGEAADIHPRDKQNVGKRLARLALANDYGLKITDESPMYDSVTFDNGKATVKFKEVGKGLDTFDIRNIVGFTIAGEDKKFVPAQAKKINANTIEVSSAEVPSPAAVRYAWADNPVANLQNTEGLPVTPFRTDDFEGVTAKAVK